MTGWYLLAGFVLLLANGFFVGAEFALIAARRSRIEQLAEGGSASARAALASTKELSLMLAGAQLGITMASLGLGHVAEPAVARVIEDALQTAELPAAASHSIAFVVALGIVVFLHMVIGEMAPKNIAIAEPERTALRLALPFRIYVAGLHPFIRLLNALANAGLHLLRVEPQDELIPAHSPEEFGIMIEASARGGMIDQLEHRLLSGAIGFSNLDAGAVMIPRTEIVALPSDATPADIERLVLETGHSRFPIFGIDIDNILGFVHAKDLLKVAPEDRDRPISRMAIRPMPVVPESLRLSALLLNMRRQRKHFALVVEEHGGTAGVVALEDVLEELVGEIRDEHDAGELDIETIGEGRFLVPGSLRIDEAVERLGVALPEGDYETIGGFLMDRLGRIPKRRDAVEHDGWRIRVRSMRRRRVVQVLIERI